MESRFFNPLIGIDEDAATGTAAGPLIGFLAKNNYTQLNKKYKILQGVKLNQPSIIEVMVRENDILVGGSSIITMQGEISIANLFCNYPMTDFIQACNRLSPLDEAAAGEH